MQFQCKGMLKVSDDVGHPTNFTIVTKDDYKEVAEEDKCKEWLTQSFSRNSLDDTFETKLSLC